MFELTYFKISGAGQTEETYVETDQFFVMTLSQDGEIETWTDNSVRWDQFFRLITSGNHLVNISDMELVCIRDRTFVGSADCRTETFVAKDFHQLQCDGSVCDPYDLPSELFDNMVQPAWPNSRTDGPFIVQLKNHDDEIIGFQRFQFATLDRQSTRIITEKGVFYMPENVSTVCIGGQFVDIYSVFECMSTGLTPNTWFRKRNEILLDF